MVVGTELQLCLAGDVRGISAPFNRKTERFLAKFVLLHDDEIISLFRRGSNCAACAITKVDTHRFFPRDMTGRYTQSRLFGRFIDCDQDVVLLHTAYLKRLSCAVIRRHWRWRQFCGKSRVARQGCSFAYRESCHEILLTRPCLCQIGCCQTVRARRTWKLLNAVRIA